MAETHEKPSPSIGAWSNGKGFMIYANGDGAGAGTMPASPFAFSENTLGALFLANLVAAIPGLQAARTPSALLLHEE